MSVKVNGADPTKNSSGLFFKSLKDVQTAFTATNETWIRNPSWPACEANSGDNKMVGLYAVWPYGGNFIAITVSGAYTVDYGDGTTTNYTSGSTAYYEIDYNDADLSGTDAPVALTAQTNTADRIAHGYINGMTVSFYNIVSTTGILEGQQYYVVNATANTFQVASTPNGSAIDLVNDGSATLLPYKIATVTITPQSGSNITNINLYVKHNQSGLANGYSTGWLDIAIAASTITNLSIGSSGIDVRHNYLERVRLNQLGAISSFSSLFRRCVFLRNVSVNDLSSVTDTNNMFNACYKLIDVMLADTSSVTDMSNMFNNCISLTNIPLFDTSSVTTTVNMFNACYSLTNIPLFDTSSALNMSGMFSNCNALSGVPLLDVSAVTSSSGFSNIFLNCNSISSIKASDFNYTFSVANCKLSSAALDEIYTNLPTVVGQTITVTGNYGTAGDNPLIAMAKGWTVTG